MAKKKTSRLMATVRGNGAAAVASLPPPQLYRVREVLDERANPLTGELEVLVAWEGPSQMATPPPPSWQAVSSLETKTRAALLADFTTKRVTTKTQEGDAPQTSGSFSPPSAITVAVPSDYCPPHDGAAAAAAVIPRLAPRQSSVLLPSFPVSTREPLATPETPQGSLLFGDNGEHDGNARGGAPSVVRVVAILPTHVADELVDGGVARVEKEEELSVLYRECGSGGDVSTVVAGTAQQQEPCLCLCLTRFRVVYPQALIDHLVEHSVVRFKAPPAGTTLMAPEELLLPLSSSTAATASMNPSAVRDGLLRSGSPLVEGVYGVKKQKPISLRSSARKAQ